MAITKIAGAIAAIALTAGVVYTQLDNGPAVIAVNIDETDRAVGGYDSVAYLASGKAIPGKEQHAITHEGAKYSFASAATAAQFEADPAAYKPQFGGWCAYGVRMGKKLPVDPKAYQVVDGKLYLFLDRATMGVWLEDRDANLSIARKTWEELI